MIEFIDEGTPPEKLPQVLFKWLYKAITETQIHPENCGEVFHALKLALRLLATKNPQAQSHALRCALGNLIKSISSQKANEQICVDILGLLVRIVDSKIQYKYNPMKHLAISGLGDLVNGRCLNSKQNSANIFVLCHDALKVAPSEHVEYRNTILWSLSQSVTDILPGDMIKFTVRAAKQVIETGDELSVANGFDFLTAVIKANAGNQYFAKRMDSSYSLFMKYGASSTSTLVQKASAKFYSALLTIIPTLAITSTSATTTSTMDNNFRQTLESVVASYRKLMNNKTSPEIQLQCKLHTYRYVLYELVNFIPAGKEFTKLMDEWAGDLLLQLDPQLSKLLVVDLGFKSKLIGDQVKCKAVDGMLKILTRAYPLEQALLKNKTAVLESALVCISGGISLLRGAVQLVADPIHLATMGIILNSSANLPTETVGYVASSCVSLIKAEPKLLMPTMELCLKQFDNLELVTLPIAVVLSRVIAISKELPLFGDINLIRKSTELALMMVKERQDLKKYTIAWVILTGIFNLGGDSLKPLVSQLLNLWEHHLSEQAFEYPEFVEQSLSGLTVFLAHNTDILTKDVIKRLGKLLYNVWTSVESQQMNPKLRRRLLACYDKLLDTKVSGIYPASLLTKYVAHFSSVNTYDKERGVLLRSAVSTPMSMSLSKLQQESKKTYQLSPEFEPKRAIDAGLSFEHPMVANDLIFWLARTDQTQIENDLYTDVVNLAISVCAKTMRFQPVRIQESVLNAIHTDLTAAMKLNSVRKVAVVYNISEFMVKSFDAGMQLKEPRNIQIAVEILKLLVRSPQPKVRENGAKSSEMLFKSLDLDVRGFPLMLTFTRELIDTARSMDDISARAGAVLSIGFISRSVSHQALFEALDKVVLPLAVDLNEVVFVSVVSGLAALFSSKENIDVKFMHKCLKTLTLAYLQNSKGAVTQFQLDLAAILAQMVSRMGPQISSSNFQSSCFLIQALAGQLQSSSNREVRIAADNVFIELFYFVRHEVNWKFCTARWIHIVSDQTCDFAEIDVACGGLLTVLNDAKVEIASTVEYLWDALWLVLDRFPFHSGARRLIEFFMFQKSGDANALVNWLQLLGLIISKPRQIIAQRFYKSQPSANNANNANNANTSAKKKSTYAAELDGEMDEDESLGIVSDESDNELFNWEARKFAIELLLQLLHLVGDYTPQTMTRIVGDIVKIAFSAATSTVVGLQLAGLGLLNEIVLKFGDIPDPDFPQISLLEQYQVQIGTALSSVFNSDSSPSLVITALRTCCSVFNSEIMRNKEWFSKLFKILENAIEGMQSAELFQLGELELTYDAAKVLQIGVLGVWAQIQISSVKNPVLADVVKPRISQLIFLWGQHVGEFARLTSLTEVPFSATSFADAIDQMKDSQDKELLIPAYHETWLLMIKALTTVDESERQTQLSAYSDNDFFFMLFGLSTQALISCLKLVLNTSPTMVLETLEAILAKPGNSAAICSEIQYIDECVPILYRAMMVGSNNEQMNILRIIRHLSAELNLTEESIDLLFDMMKTAILPLRQYFPFLFESHFARRPASNTSANSRTNDGDANTNVDGTKGTPADSTDLNTCEIQLIRLALETMIDIAKDFPSFIQSDLWVCLIKIFEEINGKEPALAAPSFRNLLVALKGYINETNENDSRNVLETLLGTFKRVLKTQSVPHALLVCTGIVCTNLESFKSESGLYEISQYSSLLNSVFEKETASEINETDFTTAMQCLVMTLKASQNSDVESVIIRACFASLIKIGISTNVNLKQRLQAMDALTVYAALSGSQGAILYIVTAILNLVMNTPEGAERSKQQLLQIITKQPQVFKSVVADMDYSDRQFLQRLLEQSNKDEPADFEDEEEEESIALATFD